MLQFLQSHRDHIRQAALAVLLTAAFGLSVAMSMAWTMEAGGVAAIWPANGLLAAGLILLKPRWAAALAAVCVAANVAIVGLLSFSVGEMLIFPPLNLGEALVAVFLARRVCGPQVRLTGLVQVWRLLLLAVLPATAASSIAAAIACDLVTGASFQGVLANWFLADALGMMVVLPATLFLLRRREDDFRRSLLEYVILFGSLTLVAVGMFYLNRAGLILLLFPVLGAIAFRLGPQGASAGALIVTAITVPSLLAQHQSMVDPAWSLTERIHNLQILIAVAFLTSLCTALAVAEQARLRRLWAARSRTASRGGARAAAAARTRADFIAAMSHEIRNPLTSIVGFTEVLLKRDDLPETARRQLTMVDRASAALVGIVDDITDLSRLDTAATQPQPRDTTPQAIARDALAIVADRARAKGVGLEQTLAGLVDQPCRVDDLRLRQILLNLLDNALKFTDRGHIRLDVGARLDGERLMLRFAVTDTGPGVAPERVGRLFDNYGHADPDRGESWSGSGLGLAVCKRLIELLGGRIGVESIAGKGATFWIEAPAEPIAEAPAKAGSGRLDARVLLVDDNPANRELGATVLDLLGCEVTLAEDGAEALELIGKGGFDIVLMDVHMPRMNGLDATRAIRALSGPAAATPIIAMTADVLPEQVERCRAAGMVDHIGKPIRLDDLHAALERWVGKTAEGTAANAA